MERYCGYLQAGLRSKTHPWANLNNWVLHRAYIEHIDINFNLDNKGNITRLSRYEKVFDECELSFCQEILNFRTDENSDPHSILRPPHYELFQPDKLLCSKIARYLSVIINCAASKIQKKIPANIPSWGKVRIANGGDSIRAASSSRRPEKERNISFVRVCYLNLFSAI